MTDGARTVCGSCHAVSNASAKFCGNCGEPLGSSLHAPHPNLRRTAPARAFEADRRLSDSNKAWLGKVIDGRYRVLEVIGRGGVGVIYKVEHTRMGKLAAMKVLHRDLANDPDLANRFVREATAVSKLNHPNTVQVFDFGTAHGSMYLIMEYVRGLDMAYIIGRDGPMRFSRAAPLLLQICGALTEAHDAGIVHRDLKPENVLITRNNGGRDFAKVTDFGLAKFDEQAKPGELAATDRAMIVGTPYFMAPEQIRGDDIDPRADIYSFGALMFNVLTGEQLFAAPTAVAVLTKHLTQPPDLPSVRAPDLAIAPAVDAIVAKALHKDREQRFASIAALAAAIEEAVASSSASRPEGSSGAIALGSAALEINDNLQRADLDDFEKSLRRRRGTLFTVGLGLTAAIVGGAGYLMTRPSPLLTVESERNDEWGNANRIRAGRAVTGFLGKRRSVTDADRDIYRVADAKEGSVVTVELTAIPNMNVAVSLIGADGKALVTADEGALGDGEVLYRRQVRGGFAVAVEQVREPAERFAIENVSDPYSLTVTLHTPSAGFETEPNATAADATLIDVGGDVTGTLEARRDVDVLRYNGQAGKRRITVTDAGNLLRWQMDEGPWQQASEVETDLVNGTIIRLRRADADRPAPDPQANRALWQVRIR